jgi:CDP-4-dehydro-6-deoxyglucose reductase
MNAQTAELITLNHFSPDIKLIELQAPMGFSFEAGQYVFLGLNPDDMKPFSIASAPSELPRLIFHVRNTHHSEWMEGFFGALSEGVTLSISAAQNHLNNPAVASAKTLVLVAGGTGFAPLRSLLVEALAQEIPPRIYLFWGVRDTTEYYARQELESLKCLFPELTYCISLSEPKSQCDWTGCVGMIHLQIEPVIAVSLSQATAVLCGPPPMVQSTKTALMEKGLAEKNIIA